MTDDYGLARVAALRGRLLDASTLGQLRGAATAAVFLRSLERSEDWGPVVRLVAPLAGDPLAAADAAIERHRSLRIGRLPRWFEPPTRRLVEALVLPLDRERCIALLRLRRSGAGAEAIGALVAPGALLDAAALGDLARAPTLADIVARLAVVGLVAPEHVPGLLRAAGEAGDPAGWGAFEARLDAAVEEARALRAAGRSENAGSSPRSSTGRRGSDGRSPPSWPRVGPPRPSGSSGPSSSPAWGRSPGEPVERRSPSPRSPGMSRPSSSRRSGFERSSPGSAPAGRATPSGPARNRPPASPAQDPSGRRRPRGRADEQPRRRRQPGRRRRLPPGRLRDPRRRAG